jgi:hypothetical protein
MKDFFFLKKTQIKKYTFPCLFIWEWTKCIEIWNYPSDNYDLWNIKLSCLNQLRWINVIENILIKNTTTKCHLLFYFHQFAKWAKKKVDPPIECFHQNEY